MISLIAQFTKSIDFAVLYSMIDHGFYDGGYNYAVAYNSYNSATCVYNGKLREERVK